ncbi:MAG TPA: hypothetical protein VGB62_06795 [Allosphingosinicella sp.]|jgi:hypothetical protein
MAKRHVSGALALLIASAAQGQTPPAPAPAPQPIIEDPCKSRDSEDILVCGNRQADNAYRLPPLNDGFDPWGTTESVSRERHQLLGPETAGNGSCSTVGAGGWTGCDIANIKKAEQMGRRIGVGTARFRVGVQPERDSFGPGRR